MARPEAVQGNETYAMRANISKATAKAHLKAVLAKTGVRRQPELVRLLGHVAASHIPMTLASVVKRPE